MDTSEKRVYHIRWCELEENLSMFLDTFSDELEETDLILSFRRGGTILGTIICCETQDLNKNKKKIYIREIPRGIYARKNKHFYLLDKITDEREYEDIYYLIEDIEKLMSTEKLEKLNILLVDNNLTSGLRINFFENVLKFFSREVWENKIGIKTLCYKKSSETRPNINFVIDNIVYKSGPIEMPWHENYNPKLNEIISSKDFDTRELRIRSKIGISIDEMYQRVENRGKKLFKKYKLEKYFNCPEFYSIFGVKRGKDVIRVYNGNFIFKITFLDKKNLIISIIHHLSSDPRKCSPENPVIEEKLRICKEFTLDNFSRDLCYECLFWSSFKDLFKIIFHSVEIESMVYLPDVKKKENSFLSKWVKDYLIYIKEDD